MMFSTRAEYGVRVMIQLGRRHGAGPVSLADIAEAEELPLAYLEQLVARLRKAELVTSTRGAHGGYELARAPEEITMAEVVNALEGTLVPMQCFTEPRRPAACSATTRLDGVRELRDQAAVDPRAGRRRRARWSRRRSPSWCSSPSTARRSRARSAAAAETRARGASAAVDRLTTESEKAEPTNGRSRDPEPARRPSRARRSSRAST